MTSEQALRVIAKTRFRPFTKTDWDAFAGCGSSEPLIGEAKPPSGSVCADGDSVAVVVDGDVVNIIASDGEFYLFKLVEM